MCVRVPANRHNIVSPSPGTRRDVRSKAIWVRVGDGRPNDAWSIFARLLYAHLQADSRVAVFEAREAALR